jgi:hypothetical protein
MGAKPKWRSDQPQDRFAPTRTLRRAQPLDRRWPKAARLLSGEGCRKADAAVIVDLGLRALPLMGRFQQRRVRSSPRTALNGSRASAERAAAQN